MHPNAELVAGRLRELGATGEVVELPEPAPTAAAAAAQLDCEVGAIANSLVFAATLPAPAGEDDRTPSDAALGLVTVPLLVLTSGAHRVDTAMVASLIGAAEVARATPEFVREATGQPIGGVAPIGHPRPLRTLVDVWLRRYDLVWAAAGHPHTVFPTSFNELLRLTGGTPAQVG